MPETDVASMDFQAQQRAFAAHLRDPANNPAPAGIEDRRLKIYRELFYNNVEGFLSTAFPVIRSLYSDERWHAMARDFFARHRCEDPQFHRIPAEFLGYLDEERQAAGDPPFLQELAHYEWVELDLSVATDRLSPELAEPNGDLLEGVPVVSPLARALAYDWPVHRIAADHLPEAPGEQPTYLIVYRDRADKVGFMEANAVTARLLQLLEDEPASGREQLLRLAEELQHPDPDQVLAFGAQMLADLRARDILLGSRR